MARVDPIRARNSDIVTFKKCRVLWEFTSFNKYNYRPLRPSLPLVMGTAIHAGLQALYSPAKIGEPEILTTAEAIAAFVDSLRNSMSAEDYDNMGVAQLEELGRGMLTNYISHIAERDIDWEVQGAEIGFSVSLPLELTGARAHDDVTFIVDSDTGVPYLAQMVYDHISGTNVPRLIKVEGQIDLIFKNKRSDGLWIWDHKTRAHIQPDSFDWFELEPQANTYYWVGYKALELKVEGVLFNYLAKMVPSKPSLIKSGKRLSVDKSFATSHKLYREAIAEHGFDLADYAKFLSTYKEPTYFHREPVYRGPDDLDIIEKDLVAVVEDMINSETRIYPNPSESNCKNCAFKGPCKARYYGEDPVQWIDTSGLYVKNTTYGVPLDANIFDE